MADISDLVKKLKEYAFSSGSLQQAAGTAPVQPTLQITQDASIRLRQQAEENAAQKRLRDALAKQATAAKGTKQ